MNVSAVALIAGVMVSTAVPSAPAASDLTGRVLFAGLAVPGATVTVTRAVDAAPGAPPEAARPAADRAVTTLTNDEGAFRLANLEDGSWTLHIEMRGFVTTSRDITLPSTEPSLTFTLKMRPYNEILAAAGLQPALGTAPGPPKPDASPDSPAKAADDPDIINGSTINGAATPFAQPRAFGNNRPRQGRLYTGAATAAMTNSAWNAHPYSFGGSSGPAPDTGNLQLGFTLGGPLRIPWLLRSSANMMLGLQHGVMHNATTQSAFMPTLAERLGDFSQSGATVRDPLTGQPFAGNVMPSNRISPQAAALLAYYPLPNTLTTTGANFQRPIVATTKQDGVQLSLSKAVTRRDTINGTMSFRRTVTDSIDLFDFADRSRQSSLNSSVAWQHRVSTRLQVLGRYQFTGAGTNVTPFFASRANVSGEAGIVGNEQSPVNWGPPTISFPDITALSDVAYQRSTTRTHAVGAEVQWRRGRHNITFGGDLRRTGLDVSSQPDPRGTLSFTGAATGRPFADFLLGLPTTSSIAFATTETRLRGNSYNAYLNDDFRFAAGVTLNVGVRWEYEAPYTELAGRLVNLDVTPGFTAAAPVLATSPTGSLTGASYPTSLLRPDKRGFEPRVATSWRPVLASSLVLRASYAFYRNLGVYQPLALLLAKQPPFSNTFSVQNGPLTPLTLASPFASSSPTNANTLAVDPGFRPAYVHSWQVSAQRDLPASLTVIAAYLGDKGTHVMQAFLPNTSPAGAVNPCAACPTGFVYIASNGASIRHAAQFTLRRRLHSGFTATAQYTFSKSTDDAASFSNRSITPSALAIAQDWRNLGAERGPSSFDQRHVLSVQFQYTTGMGVTGGTLVDGVKGSLFKDWTIDGQLNTGSGLPFTPVSFLAVAGTGFVGVRPSLTGVSPAPTTPGSYANAAAYATPPAGAWGDAGRNSIRGPAQFSLDMSVSRTFRLGARMHLDWRVSATNVLNRVTFSTINTVVTSPQFGLPTHANSMRRLQTSFRFGF